ncbi:hypothetical protein IE81DRAFT_325667 [Ceraceosorus guamensis]|uniref:FTP domain-containing protein n=1 Tax=Ceraceosorus guamensis TaxID=1522189 RepID=A0A316VSM5_9BASI|nr:hypothetical protein IE81DRAFT_325667 [Ceraceosorus guamensis]PWN40370.1 hypothetical protein IE81DRAFT_325667 [Ceraceosorus guamensis]
MRCSLKYISLAAVAVAAASLAFGAPIPQAETHDAFAADKLFGRAVGVEFNGLKDKNHQQAIQTAVDHHQTSYPAMTGFSANGGLHKNPATGDTRLHVTGTATDANGATIPYTSTVNGNTYQQHHIPLAPGQSYTDKKGNTHVGRRMEQGEGRFGLVAWE